MVAGYLSFLLSLNQPKKFSGVEAEVYIEIPLFHNASVQLTIHYKKGW